jgi:hypothetical protein
MEITIDIDNDILSELRTVSEQEDRTFQETVDEILRLGLTASPVAEDHPTSIRR